MSMSADEVKATVEDIAEKIRKDVNLTQEKRKSARRGFALGTIVGGVVGSASVVGYHLWQKR